jgi:hypothetical protein
VSAAHNWSHDHEEDGDAHEEEGAEPLPVDMAFQED